jgi:hypothetical protein
MRRSVAAIPRVLDSEHRRRGPELLEEDGCAESLLQRRGSARSVRVDLKIRPTPLARAMLPLDKKSQSIVENVIKLLRCDA